MGEYARVSLETFAICKILALPGLPIGTEMRFCGIWIGSSSGSIATAFASRNVRELAGIALRARAL